MKVLNKYDELLLGDLMVNPANDRHGELDDEIGAMNWLLADSKARIKTLAKDIAEKGFVFSAPLVSRVDDVWMLHDGNRRVTCVKMLHNPTLASDVTWQRFFEKLASKHKDNIPQKLVCRVEEEAEVIDDIVFRLHAGGESGVGTVAWNPRQQQNHSIRTGKQETPSLGIQIEGLMRARGLLSEEENLPIRNLERLLSSKRYQRQVGIEYKKGGGIGFVVPEDKVMEMLGKVCRDLMEKKITIDGLIKNEQKDIYFEKIAGEGFALKDSEGPQASVSSSQPEPGPDPRAAPKPKPKRRQPIQKPRHYLIPSETSFVFDDDDDLNRIKAIIEELQSLPLKRYVNAVSVLFRVLIEACTNHYNEKHGLHPRSDKIHVAVKSALDHMVGSGRIYGKDAAVLKKFSQQDEILSAHTFHTYVHSPHITPSEQHLCSMWDSFRRYIQNCVSQASDAKEKDVA